MASKVDVAIEMPQEVAWATNRHLEDSGDVRGPAPSEPGTPPRDPAAARGFLGLLRACALTGGGGSGGLLHASLAIALNTVFAGITLMFQYHNVEAELALGKTWIEAAAKSGFFGMLFLLMWAALVFCYIASRRQFGHLLVSVRQCLDHAASVPGYRQSAQQLRREVASLLAVAVGMTVLTAIVVFYMIYVNMPCVTLSTCLMWQLYGVLFDFSYVSFSLIPLKFVFVGLQVNSGFRGINVALKDSLDRKAPPGPAAIDQMMSLQDDLAQLFTSLTKAMACELITAMAYGTIANVTMWLLLIVSIQGKSVAKFGPILSLYVLGAGVTVVLPCEMIQRVLATLGRTRDLLLRNERRQPQLGQQLSLFRDTVGRDLETLGDLGLFRLQRSTILSISATIITYIIVMVQFLQTEGDEGIVKLGREWNATGSI